MLLVCLTDDGRWSRDKVGCDKLALHILTWQRQISGAPVVSEIKRTVNTVDESRVRSKTWPYFHVH